MVETPAYDVTIFKVHYGKMTLKIYTKGERVLRIEVIVHNTREYRWGRSLPCFPDIVTRLKGILERFLNTVGCMNASFVSDETLEKLPEPAQIGHTRVGGIDLNKLRTRRVAEAVLALSQQSSNVLFGQSRNVLLTGPSLEGGQRTATDDPSRTRPDGPRRAAYDIKKLRAKGMVSKIGKSRRYESVPDGIRSLTALLILRDKVIQPLLAASTQPESPATPAHPTPIDQHYESLRSRMRELFTHLGIAA